MALSHSVSSLRCRLCRSGLLTDYEVYCLPQGQFGLPGEPVLIEHTRGYFYQKNIRHFAEILEIAGDLAGRSDANGRLLAFDDNAAAGDLILIDGTFYRVCHVREVYPPCRILGLEVYAHDGVREH